MLIVSPARMMVFFPRKVASISPSKTRKHFLEVMAMRRRAAARWNVHVDETVATGGVFAGHKDRVRVSHQPDVRTSLGHLTEQASVSSRHRPRVSSYRPAEAF